MSLNYYKGDLLIQKILKKSLPKAYYEWADNELSSFGESCANEINQRAIHTDREGQPRLIKYNKFGEDVSEVWVNDGYKQTVSETYKRGIVGYVHKEIPALGHKGNYVYSFAQGYLLSQSEPGFYCPVTLTMATALLLDRYANEDVKQRFLPHVISTGEINLYEGATFLTERQGGSDVGANVVHAQSDGDTFRITGEKYFASNAGNCGVAMVLARTDGASKGSKGLSLFAVPWRREDGSLNGITIRRLKDKLGVRAVPSAEVEFQDSVAYLVGKQEKGIHYMMEALNLSRICNAVASIGIMRRAYREALTYATDREAFGQTLTTYPMIQDTLLNMAVKLEIETIAIFQLVSEYDELMNIDSESSVCEEAYVRLLIAILKKESAEQAIHFSHEAIEMLGGNGYIEDFVTPRLLRDAQVLTVWEGTANILGIEVLRLMSKHRVHHYFEKRILQKLDNVSLEWDKYSEQIKKELHELVRLTTFVEQADELTKTYYSKRVAKKMLDVFEATVALEWAAEGESREKRVLERFLKQTFNQDGSFESAEHVQVDFNEIIIREQK
ncbi:acyl-CoA dehydrogenase family protein [Bacillus sp. FJAT-45037]|uniref:acyl-CoA dehydrogenase family protein n=1 Tax=Bacillus sp. FJAT-45037 TaxID=2011007 RepID=UPI000C23649B|nr:acyl-CoA dehydrogenase family protein [Bacillus sp. FJAT-45037]